MTPAHRARKWLWTAPAAVLAAGCALALAYAGKGRMPPADFTFNNNSEVSTLDPAAVSSVPEGRILRALGEGLVIRAPGDLAILPGAAESWEGSPDGMRWTFRLREGLQWSNGDPLTSADFEYSFRRLLEPATGSPFASFLFPVSGARDFHLGGATPWEDVGVDSSDPRTLVLALDLPRPYFLHLLASTALLPVHRASLEDLQRRFPQTWSSLWLKPEHLVTNGPFVLAARRINDRIRLQRNPRYWDVEHVAFRTLDALAIEHAGTALNLYLTGGCDWLDGSVPSLFVHQLLGREDFRPKSSPYLGLYFYRLNCTRPPLDDARVRRALSLAIDRAAICAKLLQAGQEPCETYVPWGGIGLYRSPVPEEGEAALARRALQAAGYSSQKRLPPLSIHYNTAESHRDIAQLVANDWKQALGAEVSFANQEWKVWLDSQNRLDYQISRSSWIADYPDAGSFLSIFRSDDPNNRTGWKNAEFDDLIARAERQLDPARRNALLAKAELILQAEVPAIPIYSYVTQNVVNPRLGGFFNNVLNEQNPKFWYWKSDDELWAERRLRVGSMATVDAPGPAAGLYPEAGPLPATGREAEAR